MLLFSLALAVTLLAIYFPRLLLPWPFTRLESILMAGLAFLFSWMFLAVHFPR